MRAERRYANISVTAATSIDSTDTGQQQRNTYCLILLRRERGNGTLFTWVLTYLPWFT